MLIRDGIFSDETVDFKVPYEPEVGDIVTLRLRTVRGNATRAELLVNGSVLKQMKRKWSKGLFDYYEISFLCQRKTYQYCFVVSDDEESVYYNRMGCMESDSPAYRFSFVPGFHVPEWARGTVYYQIMTDRFCNGNRKNDVLTDEYEYHGHVRHIANWDELPEKEDIHNFHGGDLQGVMKKLDYLQELGVETIYFNPLFLSPSNHKYDTQDYEHIDPHLAVIEEDEGGLLPAGDKNNTHAGRYVTRVTSQKNLEASNRYFAGLVEEMHRRGMRVVIDGVFNHCGSFNKWMDREGIFKNREGFALGAYQSLKSPYRSYFKFDKPSVAHSSYEGWWNYDTLPKLNYEQSRELWEHILQIGEQWVSAPYRVDGWRLDVAADLGHSEETNHAFWQNFRARVRKANPEAVLIAEHYLSARPWLDGGLEWDSVMNYNAFMEPVTWFLTGMEKHSDSYDEHRYNNGQAFFAAMMDEMSKLPRPSLDAAMNELSNHDHSRFLTRTNRTVGRLNTKGSAAAGQGIDKRVMKLAVLMQMTWPGSPGLYYGDEAGLIGWTDPDNRRAYPWGSEDRELLDYHKQAIALRCTIRCLRLGSLVKLGAGDGYVAYGRMNSADCAAVIINNASHAQSITIPVWLLGVPENGAMRRAFISSDMEQAFPTIAVLTGRQMTISLPAKSGCVYTYQLGESEQES